MATTPDLYRTSRFVAYLWISSWQHQAFFSTWEKPITIYASIERPRMCGDATYHSLSIRSNEAAEPSDSFEPHQIDAYYGIGFACLGLQEWDEAAISLAQAVYKHRTTPFHDVIEGNGLSLIDLAIGIAAYAEVVSRIGDYDRSRQLCEEAIVLYRRRDHRYVDLLGTYATTLRALRNEDKAATIEHEATTLRESIEAKMRRHRFRRRRTPDPVNL